MNKTNLIKGRVIANHVSKYIVEYNKQKYTLEVSGRFKYIAYLKSDYPVVGDYVLFRETGDLEGIIESVVERENTLKRLGTYGDGNEQLIAANIDIVFVCMSLNEDFHIKKLHNFLRLAHNTNFEAIVLLTKKDLCEDIEVYITQVESITSDPIYTISIYDQDDIGTLHDIIDNKTAVFIGSSGVGKSSIVNGLLGEEHFKTNGIRISDAQGHHTTVHRELVHLDNGGSIIDSPGIRIVNSFYVDNLEDEFSDITTLSKECRFSDCTHTSEPGCAVQDALISGELDENLFDSYNHTLRLNAHAMRQARAKTRRQEKRKKYGRK